MLSELSRLLFDVVNAEAISAADAKSIFDRLAATDDLHLAPICLRGHFGLHGLFGHTKGGRRPFLTAEKTEEHAASMAQRHRELHLRGALLPALWSLVPIHNMVDVGVWDEACRAALDVSLQDQAALDGFTLLGYGGARELDRRILDTICNREQYLERVGRRLSALGPPGPANGAGDPSLRAALEKAACRPP